MEPRSRPLFAPIEIVRFWLRDYGLAASTVALLCVVTAGLLAWLSSFDRRPERLEEATVVRFGHYVDTKWRPSPVVVVRTRDGAVRQLAASPHRLSHCRSGGPILLVRRGAGLFVHSRGCRAPAVALGGPASTWSLSCCH